MKMNSTRAAGLRGQMEDGQWAGEEGGSEGGRKEESPQRGRRGKGRKEDSKQGGGSRQLRTRRGIRAVEVQPDFRTIQDWSRIQRTF